MAIRKPAWDIPLDQIDARASRLKLDRDYFARLPQARADSAAGSREVEQAVLEALSKTMSPAELREVVVAYSLAVGRGENVDLASFVRADSENVSLADGLRRTTFHDAMGRPIYWEYANTGNRKKWLDPYRAPMQEQVMLNVKQIPMDQFPAVEAKWREDRENRNQVATDLAHGTDVRFVDLETGERVQ